MIHKSVYEADDIIDQCYYNRDMTCFNVCGQIYLLERRLRGPDSILPKRRARVANFTENWREMMRKRVEDSVKWILRTA